MRFSFAVIVILARAALVPAQEAAVNIPDPLRFYIKYETVWEVVRASVLEMQFDIQIEDRSGGTIQSKWLEFSSGGLTAGDLVKFCVPPQLTDANWVKARYSLESRIERVTPREVLLTVNVAVEGSKRDFQGQVSWVPCPSSGTLERRFYSRVGSRLLGNKFDVPQKKGFWEKNPQPVPGQRTEPALPKPDRPPPPEFHD